VQPRRAGDRVLSLNVENHPAGPVPFGSRTVQEAVAHAVETSGKFGRRQECQRQRLVTASPLVPRPTYGRIQDIPFPSLTGGCRVSRLPGCAQLRHTSPV
jgi:hypothetical protein